MERRAEVRESITSSPSSSGQSSSSAHLIANMPALSSLMTQHPNPSSDSLGSASHTLVSPVTVIHDPSSLTHLIYRLEAATSRLEDIANSSGAPEHNFDQANGLPSSTGDSTLQHGTRSEPNLPGLQSRAPTSSTVVPTKQEDLPPSIQAMDELISEHVTAFVAAGAGLDALVQEQVRYSRRAKRQRHLLTHSSHSRKPFHKRSPTNVDSYSSVPRPRSPIRSPSPSWTSSPIYNTTWAPSGISGIAIAPPP